MFVQLKLVKEEQPGEKWKDFFDRVWPFYKKWFLSEGYLKREGYMSSYEQLETHMPELLPIYEKLCELAGGGDLESRFLSMYKPPAYMSGCSQIAWLKGSEPALIRNYDYHPKFFDGTVMYTNWLKPVIGMIDCTWGLLDGINESGLSVSLTFGGRKITGEGFGIPIVVRYLLETCDTVEEASRAVAKIPVHMTYNLTILDKDSNFVTVYLSPDRKPVFVKETIGTNYQCVVEWVDYAIKTNTVGRKKFLEGCIHHYTESRDMLGIFLKPPLYFSKYKESFGTLYTSMYKPLTKEASFVWPNKRIDVNFDNFAEKTVQINLSNFSFKNI